MKRQILYPFALFLTAAMLVACSGGKPEETVDAFYHTTADGNVDDAVKLISFSGVGANEMVQAKGKVQMVVGELHNRIEANDGLDTVETVKSETSEDGQKAMVSSKIIFGNGKSMNENAKLIKDDGNWKIVLQ